DKELGIYNVCNYYGVKGYPEGNIHAAVFKFFSRLLKTADVSKFENCLSIKNVYQNKHINWSFTTPDRKFIGHEQYHLSLDAIGRIVECAKCHYRCCSDDVEVVDNYNICPNCVA